MTGGGKAVPQNAPCLLSTSAPSFECTVTLSYSHSWKKAVILILSAIIKFIEVYKGLCILSHSTKYDLALGISIKNNYTRNRSWNVRLKDPVDKTFNKPRATCWYIWFPSRSKCVKFSVMRCCGGATISQRQFFNGGYSSGKEGDVIVPLGP